jgi:hypothetical protein
MANHDPIAHVASWLTPPVSGAAADERPATVEEMAAIEFEAIGPEVGAELDAKLRTFEQTSRDHGITLRFASTILQRSKSELVEMVDTVAVADDFDAFEEMLDEFKASKGHFETLIKLLDAAHTRAMVAAAARAVRGPRP